MEHPEFNDLADVRDMQLDLTKEEKLRSAALIMAIRYHVETIIKDADYLQAMIAREKEMQFSNDPDKELWHLRPSTVTSVVHIAAEFERFLKGEPSSIASVSTGEEEKSA
jgi:hypothetical protein